MAPKILPSKFEPAFRMLRSGYAIRQVFQIAFFHFATAAITKRETMVKSGGGYYAVAAGRATGVFRTWGEAEAQVKGFAGARFKKFPTAVQAQAFLAQHGAGVKAPVEQPKRAREDQDTTPPNKKQRGEAQTQQTQSDGRFYAVVEGHATGVFDSWEQAKQQTDGFARPVVRSFDSREAAEGYLDGYKAATGGGASSVLQPRFEPNESREKATLETQPPAVQPLSTAAPAEHQGPWYAVAKGRKTGVFATWKDAKKHVEGLHGASFKKFETREEAEAFVNKLADTTLSTSTDPGPHDPETLVAFCDGSALENGHRGCRAGYACIFPHHQEWNVVKKLVEARATNNRAEYFAALEAIKRANTEDPGASRVLYIFSDSMLLIRSMTEWVDNWRARGWKKADGKPVLNQDILESLVREKGDRRILWRHVKAHTGKKDWKSKWNDVADQSARNVAGS